MNIYTRFARVKYRKDRAARTAVIGLILCVFPAAGIEAQHIMGSRGIGMAGAVTALPDYEWAVFKNPAMMPAEGRHLSFFTIRYYGISELTDSALSGVYTASLGTLGIGLHSYGFDLYREHQLRLAVMKSFEHYRIGVSLHYQHVTIERYGSAGALAVNIGFAARLADGLWLGAAATNMNRAAMGEAEEELPRELAVGLSWEMAPRVLLVTDLVKDVRFPLAFRSGIEADLFREFLYLRGGITTEPLTYSLGLGISRAFFEVNLAAQHHEWLGWSPGIDLKISW